MRGLHRQPLRAAPAWPRATMQHSDASPPSEGTLASLASCACAAQAAPPLHAWPTFVAVQSPEVRTGQARGVPVALLIGDERPHDAPEARAGSGPAAGSAQGGACSACPGTARWSRVCAETGWLQLSGTEASRAEQCRPPFRRALQRQYRGAHQERTAPNMMDQDTIWGHSMPTPT